MASGFMHVISRICPKNALLWRHSTDCMPLQPWISPHRKITVQTLPLRNNKLGSKTAGPVFHEVPTSSKDVLLYLNNNRRFFRWMTIFGFTQFFFWNSLAVFFQDKAKDVDPAEELKQTTAEAHSFVYKIRDALDFKDKYKHGITLMLAILGCGFLVVPGLIALRNVHMVVLRKGGQTVDIVTFALFGSRRTIADLPLDHVSCQHSMHVKRPNLALKIKGRAMYFLVDTAGQFPNPKLFEQTVGLHRTYRKK